MDWWMRAKDATPPTQPKALQYIALHVQWVLWNHRNACVFDQANPSIHELVDNIKDEVRCWAKGRGSRAQGRCGTIMGCTLIILLAVVVPQSWDVQ
jgi:hypothetical protein